MEGLHCTKESIFPFSSCITGLNTCHATLAQAQDEACDRNKVAKMLKGTTTVNSSLVSPPCRTSVPILTPRTISGLLRASSASKSLLSSLGKPVAQHTMVNEWLELDLATGMGVVAGDMAVVMTEKAVALVKEMEEDEI
jgi:hypothetical protein